MKKKILSTKSVATLLACILCLYASRAFSSPIAALLAPVFMIRFMRSQRLITGAFILAASSSLTIILAFRGLAGTMFNSYVIFCVVMVVSTVIGLTPIFLDRYYTSRMPAWHLTLVYPTLKTFLEFAGSLNSPFGEWGASAAMFAGWLPLSQIVSVTGIWGLSFLVSWFASLTNFVWERSNDWQKIKTAVTTYATVVLVVVSFSSFRLLTNKNTATVKVAAVLANDALKAEPTNKIYAQLASFGSQTISYDSLHYFKQKFAANNHFLLTKTTEAARKGAKIIFWAEGNGMIIKSDEPALFAQAAAVAKNEKIYLGMSVEVFNPRKKFPVENKIVLIEPDGTIAWQYYKHYPIGAENQTMVVGDGNIKTLKTPYGNIAAVICYDTDFIRFARKVGKANADILFAPSNDWSAIATIRGKITRFRALENGVTLVRPTSHGVTEIIDNRGRDISSNNYFTRPQNILIAEVPIKGSRAIYAYTGDWFAFACLIIFLTIIVTQKTIKIKTTSMKKIATACLLALIAIAPAVQAQEVNGVNDTSKKSKTILFPAISYAPETSVALGISGVKLFTINGSRNSQLTATGLYTFKNQFLIESNCQMYFNHNSLMAKAKFNLNKYPENYYGIGNNTEDSSKNLVNYSVVKLDGSLMKEVATNFYIGPKINFSDYFSVHAANDAAVKAIGKKGGITTGLGMSAIYDTRDNILTSSKGVFIEISSVWNNTCFGGDFNYYSFDADLRKFFPVTKSTVLAMQALAQLKTGDVPFLQLCYLGGSNIMRGYYSGRYRDNILLAAQAELRQQLTRKFGLVLFAGYGEVANSVKQIGIVDLHQSIGVGLRRRLSKTEKINLRMDVGFVNGKANFYVNIAEAF